MIRRWFRFIDIALVGDFTKQKHPKPQYSAWGGGGGEKVTAVALEATWLAGHCGFSPGWRCRPMPTRPSSGNRWRGDARSWRAEIARERDPLAPIARDQGEMVPVARLMVELTLTQFQAELDWLGQVGGELAGRGTPREAD